MNECTSCGRRHWLTETCMASYAQQDAEVMRRLYENVLAEKSKSKAKAKAVHEIEMSVTVSSRAEMLVGCVTCNEMLYVVVEGHPRPLDDMLLAVQRHMGA